MKNLMMKSLLAVVLVIFFISACKKEMTNSAIENESQNQSNSPAANISFIPLSLTIFNPCCQENIYLTGTIRRVENSSVIHMDDHDINGIGLTSGVHYTVQSASVRNYVFDPNEYQATLNWSLRMKGENGCGYNVQFVVHVTRDPDGEIIAEIHSGNFFCLFF